MPSESQFPQLENEVSTYLSELRKELTEITQVRMNYYSLITLLLLHTRLLYFVEV